MWSPYGFCIRIFLWAGPVDTVADDSLWHNRLFIRSFIFKNIKYAYNKWIISIYGFLATFVIYGFILDTATVFMYTDTPKTETFVATYLSGIGFNLIHAASTFVVLFLISNATIKKLERLKIKYKMFS